MAPLKGRSVQEISFSTAGPGPGQPQDYCKLRQHWPLMLGSRSSGAAEAPVSLHPGVGSQAGAGGDPSEACLSRDPRGAGTTSGA